MASNLTARKESGWKVFSVPPDVCKTPMGSSVVPVPYPVYTELQDAIEVVESVKANGHPVVVFDRSKAPKTIGDKAGSATGMKSGTVEAQCEPKTKSASVRAETKWIVRNGDEFWMNGM